MDKLSLAALLDEDREMVQATLARDRSLPVAQAALEKAVDRVMYRYVEACGDELLRASAQHILQSMKNTLPLMDAVGEARAWKKQTESDRKGRINLGPLTLALLLGGLVLVLASVLGVLIGGRLSGVLAFLKALLPTVLGCGALYWAGLRSGRPGKKQKAEDAPDDVRTEYLIDIDKAWHCLRGAMLQADGQLERIREENVAERQQASSTPAGGLDRAALELFSELLETAYAAGDDSARESISAMRFYLHGAGVEAMDYQAGREGWFEFLPASRPGTMRPALVSNGKLLKKGLASK